MKLVRKRIISALAFLTIVIPAIGYAGYGSGYYGGSNPSPIHVNEAVTLYFTGSQYDLGSQVNYIVVYANGAFLCTTSYSQNTPIWTCSASFPQSGDYSVSGTAHMANGSTDPSYLQGSPGIAVVP